MREKYESLALVQLKELAKARGLKGTSVMKKAELVEAMLAEDERVKEQEAEKAAKSEETQQTRESASKPVHRRNVVTNTRSSQARAERTDRPERTERIERAERQERSERPEKTDRPVGVMNESTYRAEPTAQSESAAKTDEMPRAEGQTMSPAVPRTNRPNEVYDEKTYPKELDSGEEASGILEVMPDGYGFIRCENYLPGENDVYVAPSQIRRFGLKTGDILRGNKRVKTQQEKFSALLFIRTINGYSIEEASKRKAFEDMTPIFPDERIKLETLGSSVAMRVMDLVSPIGKGQRGMIVSPPKAGKTTLLKEVAKSILRTNPRMHMLILLIDERPEEVTDVKEAISGTNVEVIYSTFDELPDHHKRVSEMVIERAKRLVEHKKDVVILLDSITRLARAYNLVVPPSGRTLSGGLDPTALHMPKRFFGAARNMREGGSLTILATALVDTGSKMDDVIYEEFKSTGNMEMILDRKLSEKRIFPAIDLAKSGTRREDLLLSPEELEAINIMRKALNGLKSDEATDRILDMFARTRNNNEFVQMVKRNKFI
nr:transcription termination factor Rho [uncultured Acetatifactor sp.]